MGFNVIPPRADDPGLTTVIGSIQYGSILLSTAQTSNTATITSVDVAKAVLIHLGQRGNATTPAGSLITITLTDATTVTAERNSTEGGTASQRVNFCVVEFV